MKPRTCPARAAQNQNLWPKKLIDSPAARRFKAVQQDTRQQEVYWREAASKYLAMTARMDENVGRILDQLQQLKLSDRTMVVFVSSHGLAVSDHCCFARRPGVL